MPRLLTLVTQREHELGGVVGERDAPFAAVAATRWAGLRPLLVAESRAHEEA